MMIKIKQMTYEEMDEKLIASCKISGWEAIVDSKGLHLDGDGGRIFPIEELLQLRSVAMGGWGSITRILVETERDSDDLGVIGKEAVLLEVMEKLASRLEIRLQEHTGRSVEADEHGLNVLEQVQTYPERWPQIERKNTGIVQFRRIGRLVNFDIPSRAPAASQAFFWILVGLSSVIGLSTIESMIYWLIPPFVALVILIGVDFATGWFRGVHRVTLRKDGLSIAPRFMSLFWLPAKTWLMTEFRDLDVTEEGRLTLLLGDRRLFCDMSDAESRWVMAEIVNTLQDLSAE